jgi:hypothetical protein
VLNTILGLAVGFIGALLVLNERKTAQHYSVPVAHSVPKLSDPRESYQELRTRLMQHRELAHNSDQAGNHGAPCRACDLLEQRLERRAQAIRAPQSTTGSVFEPLHTKEN